MQDDPLSQLRDIHMPIEPGWWPPAPGWWLLGALVLIGLSLLILWLVRRYQNNAPKREALALLSNADAALANKEIDAVQYVNVCNALVKRLWVHAQGRAEAAALTGDQWLRYLDRVTDTDQFTNGAGIALGNQRFTKQAVEVTPALQNLLRELLATKPSQQPAHEPHRNQHD